MSRQGKTRLSKWYMAASLKEKTRMIRDITSLVLSRPQKQCNFIEFKDKKIVYKRCGLNWHVSCTEGMGTDSLPRVAMPVCSSLRASPKTRTNSLHSRPSTSSWRCWIDTSAT